MKFEPKTYYHIYNRGVDSSDTFHSSDDIKFFLNRFNYYLSLSVETYAYCILRNHFHILIRIPTLEEISAITSAIQGSDNDLYYLLPNPEKKHFPIHSLISHWLNSYTKFLNRKYNKSGPTWDGRLKKRIVDSEKYLQRLICYIHRNPIHHGIANHYSNYKFSSYSEILNNFSEIVSPDSVLNAFGGQENFIAAHREFKGNYGDGDFDF